MTASSAAEQRKTAPIATAPKPSAERRSGASTDERAEEQRRQHDEPGGAEHTAIADGAQQRGGVVGAVVRRPGDQRRPADEPERRDGRPPRTSTRCRRARRCRRSPARRARRRPPPRRPGRSGPRACPGTRRRRASQALPSTRTRSRVPGRSARRRAPTSGWRYRRQSCRRRPVASPMIIDGFTPSRPATIPLGIAPRKTPAGYAAASTPAPTFPSSNDRAKCGSSGVSAAKKSVSKKTTTLVRSRSLRTTLLCRSAMRRQSGSGDRRARIPGGGIGRNGVPARRSRLGSRGRDEPVGRRGLCTPRLRLSEDPRPLLLRRRTSGLPNRARFASCSSRTSRRVRVGSAAPFVVVDARGERLHLPARAVVVDRRFLLRHKRLAAPIRFEPGAQPLQFGGAGYRGDLVVRHVAAGLMAVNVLPLDRYLRGVVPWEVPKGWHEATYEAQAVAARSYTLATLHPGKNFDLYPDQRSQMYGGIRAERPETNLAIGATAGAGARLARPDHPGLLLLELGWQDVVGARRVAAPAPGSVSRLGDRSVRLHLAASRLADVGAQCRRVLPRVLHVQGVRDMRVVDNSSGRAQAVRVLTARGWKTFAAQVVRRQLQARLDGLPGGSDVARRPGLPRGLRRPRARARVGAWARKGAASGVDADRLAGARADPSDARRTVHGQRRSAALDRASARLQLARRRRGRTRRRAAAGRPCGWYEASCTRLAAAPVRGAAADGEQWTPVARGTGSFDHTLRPGSYRVAVLGGTAYTSFVSKPVGLHTNAIGP